MTNKERIKRAFSSVRLSEDFTLDLERKSREKRTEKRIRFRSALTAACITLALCVGGVTAYAADLGGIQRTIQVWIHGDQTTATITIGNEGGITHYSIKDSDGNEIHGGGVAIENDGTERPLTESELQEHFFWPASDTVDGHRYLFYKDQKIDITDMFNEEDLCYITFHDGDRTIYTTVARGGGSMSSEKCYVQKSEMPQEWFMNE